jgi:tRNA(Glu) U13 pseudouridine synthase TruD
MVVLKHLPEDFVVEEIPDREWKHTGSFLVVEVKKRLHNTEDVARRIASSLRLNSRAVTFAGNKDKHALTTQYMSIKNTNPSLLKNISIPDVQIAFVGYTDEPLSLGSLLANRFVINARDIPLSASFPLLPSTILIPNTFGSQRFGVRNHEVGKAIIKGHFQQACKLIVEQGGRQQNLIEQALAQQPTNLVGALRTLPRKVLLLYVHAYQSYLFNKQLSQLLDSSSLEELKNTQLPLVGFSTVPDDTLSSLLAQEGVSLRDFIVRPIPDCSCEGSTRKAVVQITDLKVRGPLIDECFPAKNKFVFSFTLPKGSYATVAIQHLINQMILGSPSSSSTG